MLQHDLFLSIHSSLVRDGSARVIDANVLVALASVARFRLYVPRSKLFQAQSGWKAVRLPIAPGYDLVFLLGLASYDESSCYLTISELVFPLIGVLLLHELFLE